MMTTNKNLLINIKKAIVTIGLAFSLFTTTVVPSFAATTYFATTNLFVPTANKYNYCPVGMQIGSDLYVAYCTNKTGGVISDNIGMRIVNDNGVSKETRILSPTKNTWDAVDVCDPSIVAGNFNYNGEHYTFLMAYLGCDTVDCQKNQIGFAVSNSLTSGWIKCDAINPVVSHNYDPSQAAFQWGVGQPSLITLDGDGNILLFYTSGSYCETCTYVELINVSDLNNIKRLSKSKVTNNGLNDFLSNGDFAREGNYIYVCCDTHPFAAGILGNVSDVESVFRMSVADFTNTDCFAYGTWELYTRIGGETTGHAKNHNAGFVRDAFGNLTAEHSILVTVADEYATFNQSLWSYRVNALNF